MKDFKINKFKPLVWELKRFGNRQFLITRKQQNIRFQLRLPSPNRPDKSFEFMITWGNAVVYKDWILQLDDYGKYIDFINENYLDIIENTLERRGLEIDTDKVSNYINSLWTSYRSKYGF